MKTTNEVEDTAKAKTAFIDFAKEIGSDWYSEMETICSAGREFLPTWVVAVFDGEEPTAPYWRYLQRQSQKMWLENSAR